MIINRIIISSLSELNYGYCSKSVFSFISFILFSYDAKDLSCHFCLFGYLFDILLVASTWKYPWFNSEVCNIFSHLPFVICPTIGRINHTSSHFFVLQTLILIVYFIIIFVTFSWKNNSIIITCIHYIFMDNDVH